MAESSTLTLMLDIYLQLTNFSYHDQDDGFWRRWIILTFNRVIPKEEYTSKLELQQRITDDLPNLAKWAIAGAQRIIKRNEYIAPPSSKETLNEWKINTDQVAQFVKCATIKPGEEGGKPRPITPSLRTIRNGVCSPDISSCPGKTSFSVYLDLE